MILIGNDIMDLQCLYNKASFENPKYLDKILTSEEQRYCLTNTEPYLAQLFWTCKESAYKILLKNKFRGSFSPKKYNVIVQNKQQNEIHAVVYYNNISCYTVSFIQSEDYIFTMGVNTQPLSTCMIYDLVTDRSEDILQNIANNLNVDANQLFIRKTNGIPHLVSSGQITNWDITISHDGRFYSYAMVYTD